MYTATAAIYVARSQVGYHEGKSGSHWDNIQKYAPAIGFTNGLAWCDTFVNWAFSLTGIKIPAGVKSAGCAVSVRAYVAAKRFTQFPVIGGQVFYGPGGGTHTGLVYNYDDTYIYTVEGNTNTNGSAEGDGVYEKKRLRRDAYVYGYGIPFYQGVLKSADPKWNGVNGGG
jgi:hypothetical protein